MRNRTYLIYIASSILVVFIVATSQMHLVLGIPLGSLQPTLYILPILLGSAFGYMIARIRLLQKQQQTQRDELEAANDALKAFSYSVSHDLRQPLRSIREFSKILIRHCPQDVDDEAKDYLARIHASSLKMGELIDALLSLAKVSQADIRLTTVDVTGLARRIVKDLSEQSPERNVEIRIEPGLKVTGDKSLVLVMLDNLLRNAWKFTAKTESPLIKVGSARQGSRKVIYVSDNGVGFNNQQAEKLFTAFQRLHSHDEFEGTGIGLATVKRIIDRHGGNIRATGEKGKGATFSFHL